MLKNIILAIIAIPLIPLGVAFNVCILWFAVGCSWFGLRHILTTLGTNADAASVVAIVFLTFVHVVAIWGLVYNLRHKDRDFLSMQRTPLGLAIYLLIASILSVLLTSCFYGMTSETNEALPKIVRREFFTLGPSSFVWLCAVFVGFLKVATEFFGQRDVI